MKKSKFTEEQIAYALRLAESGTIVADVCRQMGIAEATFYVWKKKYASLGMAELRQMRQMQEENARLKRLVVDLTLGKQILSEVIQKRSEANSTRRVGALDARAFPSQRAAGLSGGQAAQRYLVRKSQARDATALRMRIRGGLRPDRGSAMSGSGSCSDGRGGKTGATGFTGYIA
jgi:putative transposase